MQVYVHSNKISRHSSVITTEETNVNIVKFIWFLLESGMGIMINITTKNVVHLFVRFNDLVKIGILATLLENKETVHSTPRMTLNFGYWYIKS